MPSHSWPVVATPDSSSISSLRISVFLKRDLRGGIRMLLAAGAEGENDDADEEDGQRQEAPGVSEFAHRVVIHATLLSGCQRLRRRSRSPPGCRASGGRR